MRIVELPKEILFRKLNIERPRDAELFIRVNIYESLQGFHVIKQLYPTKGFWIESTF
jgi:hypothetical protein